MYNVFEILLLTVLYVFRHHLDCPAGTFGDADAAAFAIIIVEFETLSGSEFDHSVVRADCKTVVALKAIAARHTASCLE